MGPRVGNSIRLSELVLQYDVHLTVRKFDIKSYLLPLTLVPALSTLLLFLKSNVSYPVFRDGSHQFRDRPIC